MKLLRIERSAAEQQVLSMNIHTGARVILEPGGKLDVALRDNEFVTREYLQRYYGPYAADGVTIAFLDYIQMDPEQQALPAWQSGIAPILMSKSEEVRTGLQLTKIKDGLYNLTGVVAKGQVPPPELFGVDDEQWQRQHRWDGFTWLMLDIREMLPAAFETELKVWNPATYWYYTPDFLEGPSGDLSIEVDRKAQTALTTKIYRCKDVLVLAVLVKRDLKPLVIKTPVKSVTILTHDVFFPEDFLDGVEIPVFSPEPVSFTVGDQAISEDKAATLGYTYSGDIAFSQDKLSGVEQKVGESGTGEDTTEKEVPQPGVPTTPTDSIGGAVGTATIVRSAEAEFGSQGSLEPNGSDAAGTGEIFSPEQTLGGSGTIGGAQGSEAIPKE